jgi:hypothetical protein
LQAATVTYASSPLFNAHAFLAGFGAHFGRLLATPWLFVTVEYLPTRVPSADEAASGALLAEAVREQMGAATGLPLHHLGAREEMRVEADAAKARKAAEAAAATDAAPLV